MRRFIGLGRALVLGLGVVALQPARAATPLGPATFGNPNQAWGTRRNVTPADRALIASYRSGHKRPILATNFTSDADLHSEWLVQSDDRYDLKSCRDPMSVVASPVGLKLETLNATHCHAKYSTGSIWSKARFHYGFFEASMKIADASGTNNAFWMTTEDGYEIDISEIHYPNDVHLTLHNWTTKKDSSVGFDRKFADNFSTSFHDYGALWTPKELIFEIDGEPVAAIATNGAVSGTADIRFSTALASFAGAIPANPAGHEMTVRSLKVFAL